MVNIGDLIVMVLVCCSQLLKTEYSTASMCAYNYSKMMMVCCSFGSVTSGVNHSSSDSLEYVNCSNSKQ